MINEHSKNFLLEEVGFEGNPENVAWGSYPEIKMGHQNLDAP